MALNGRLPASMLGTIPGTSRRVLLELVPQTAALRAAFAAHFGKPLVVTDGYRTFEEQVRLREQKGIWAAIPGTSNHGEGRALDLGSSVNVEGSAEYRWMKANAPRFGWVHPRWAEDNNPSNGQQEPWHWEAPGVVPVSNYTAGGGTVPIAPTPAPIAPIAPIEEDDDMLIIANGKYGRALLSGSRLTGLADQDSVTGLTAAGVKTAQVSDGDFLRLVQTSTSTWVLYCPPDRGGRGYAVWAGGRAVGLGSQATVDDFRDAGAPMLTVDAADFDRFTAA